ncbi:MAG: CDP-alcohol phosphatidyltransferase family protein, partial [Cyclobacteriaceae bacterium]|nr:CDP-alcohol phosphatidyltransferase family protein [Cyclobacteriaceae bacterium HetDA_MAG_MS6]
MLNAIRKHYSEVLSTIKLIDIEERFDLVFSRFFGLFFAKAALRLRMTPTDVSIASLAVGLMGGGLLYFQESWVITLSGSILITIAGVLDSADGQLARMSGQSTDLGRIIDGLIDNLVFLACYI